MRLQYSLTSGTFCDLQKHKKVQLIKGVWSFALRGRGMHGHNLAQVSAFPEARTQLYSDADHLTSTMAIDPANKKAGECSAPPTDASP